MYKCEKCKGQSKKGETMAIIYNYRKKLKGFEIESEKKVCYNCYLKDKEKNG